MAKILICIIFFLSLCSCSKTYDYKNYSSERECTNIVYLNEEHQAVNKNTCAKLNYPTGNFRNDEAQFSEQLMLLCISDKLSKQHDYTVNWSMRKDIIRCARKHGDVSGNQFATELLKLIPSERD